jgi:succinate-semialdehyde dehydrogenase/glutarate-semialdehyde dehydrogenase
MAEQYTRLAMYIHGRAIIAAPNRTSEPVMNPATGAVLGELPHATLSELGEAADAAVAAFPAWRATSPYDRSIILRKTAAILRERADHIAQVLTQGAGRSEGGIGACHRPVRVVCGRGASCLWPDHSGALA